MAAIIEDSPVNSVLVRKTEFGDYDYILTYFTQEMGNISLIAKNAKKSKKRFCGKLELFTQSKTLFTKPKKGGLPVLTEVLLENPYENIRTDIVKTAHAAYWAELITYWIPVKTPQDKIYNLLVHLLDITDKGILTPETANLYFQVHFLKLTGFDPMLNKCASCGRPIDLFQKKFNYRLDKGGIVCQNCCDYSHGILWGANLKQLIWIRKNGFDTGLKLKFSKQNIKDCSDFLTKFISYNTGREFKSQKVIKVLEH